MKVLIVCEFSGHIRQAFTALGHEAYSLDLLPAEDNSPFHFQMDAQEFRDYGYFDLGICHPPCTDLAVSGARHFKRKQQEVGRVDGLDFFFFCARIPIPKLAVENPISIVSSHWRKPDQIYHPWMFGENESKATCLWLKNLPPLMPLVTQKPLDVKTSIHHASPGPDRWKVRSRTPRLVAFAMASQWGGVV